MKKLYCLLAALMIITSNAYATNVTIDTIVTADDVTIDTLNSIHNTLVNNLNSIPGDNIQSKSISADSMSNNANPEPRWADTFSNFVVTGLLAPTNATLTTTTTAGRALITDTANNLMKYVQKDATANTYTAGVWTYTDLNHSGTYTYVETSQGAAAPAVTTSSIRLFKVSADSTSGVGEVTDLRVVGASIGSAEDFYIKGMELRVTSADSTVVVDTGVVYHGSTRLEKTAKISLVHTTASDWWDGAADTYSSAGWNYVGIDSFGGIKFLGENPPDVNDTDGNTDGDIDRYWDDGSKKWRVLGVARVSADNTFAFSMFQNENVVMLGVPVNVTTAVSDNAWSAAIDCSDGIPAFSIMGIFGLKFEENDSSATSMFIRPNGSTWVTEIENGIGQAATQGGAHDLSGQRQCATDISQQIQLYNRDDGGTTDATVVDVEGFLINSR